VSKSFYNSMGMPCEGFEHEVMTLLTAIESSQNRDGLASPSSSLSKAMNRRHHELKRLQCSITIKTLREIKLAKAKVRGGAQLIQYEA
jgi:hypothetical protein